jgi:hypothetical protein
LHKASAPLDVDPPAGLSFHNLGPSTLETGSGYEILGNLINLYVISWLITEKLKNMVLTYM